MLARYQRAYAGLTSSSFGSENSNPERATTCCGRNIVGGKPFQRSTAKTAVTGTCVAIQSTSAPSGGHESTLGIVTEPPRYVSPSGGLTPSRSLHSICASTAAGFATYPKSLTGAGTSGDS